MERRIINKLLRDPGEGIVVAPDDEDLDAAPQPFREARHPRFMGVRRLGHCILPIAARLATQILFESAGFTAAENQRIHSRKNGLLTPRYPQSPGIGPAVQ